MSNAPMPVPTLFDFTAPRARHTDPSTSKRAAVRMAPAAPALEQQILEVLARSRGTKDEICKRLQVDPRRWPSVASCLSRLKKAGKLKWVGEYDGMNVWALVEDYVEVAGEVL